MGQVAADHHSEVESGKRFEFGKNWTRFLLTLNEDRIRAAENSLREMLGVENLEGKKFLDVGSGSGLFSLAARKLGATVYSFDYDPHSVRCTAEVRRRFFPDDPDWVVDRGSILDPAYTRELGQFDVVYSWGVLHHTGDMRLAFENVIPLVKLEGQLFVAIYNDQGFITSYWTAVKKAYNRHLVTKYALILIHFPYLVGLRWLVRAANGRLALERGMTLWYDMLDWLGGYPFEVSKPEGVLECFRPHGFVLDVLRTCRGRMGCNEFVFRKSP